MRLAMELHQRGWQVYRAYIDEKFDFVIMKAYCHVCEDYTSPWKRGKTVTNLCVHCHEDSLRMLVRFIQVKSSEGKDEGRPEERTFSFHPKIRYHLADGRVYYAWVQVWDADNVNFYIFPTSDVERFDDIQLPTYQIHDNQKTSLRIDKKGNVLTKPRLKDRDYSVFSDALNNFDALEELNLDEKDWRAPGHGAGDSDADD